MKDPCIHCNQASGLKICNIFCNGLNWWFPSILCEEIWKVCGKCIAHIGKACKRVAAIQAGSCVHSVWSGGPFFCVSDISDGTQPCVYNELRGCVFQSVIALRLHTKKTVPRCYRFGCCWHSDLKLEFLLEIKTGHMFHRSFE